MDEKKPKPTGTGWTVSIKGSKKLIDKETIEKILERLKKEKDKR